MDALEVAGGAQVLLQPLLQLHGHGVGVAGHLPGAVLGQLGDGGLRGVPLPRSVLVEVGGLRGQPAQGVAEDGRGLPGHDAAELDPAVVDSPVGRRGHRRRAEVHGPRHPARGRELAEVGRPPVDGHRQGGRAVHVLVDDRRPVVGQVAGQLVAHPVVVDGDGGRQQQRVAVPPLPQAVDHRRHEPQHAAGALEPGEGGPVRVEAVEDLGMDGVSGLEAALVVGGAALGGKLHPLLPVQLPEGAGRQVALLEGVRPYQRLEQPTAHDLEALLGAGRLPRRVDPAQHVAQPVQGAASSKPPHLRVVRLGVRRPRVGGVRGRQRDHQQAVAGDLHRGCFGRQGAGADPQRSGDAEDPGGDLVRQDLPGAQGGCPEGPGTAGWQSCTAPRWR